MKAIQRLLGRSDTEEPPTDESTISTRSAHERAKDQIGRWGEVASTFYYCELCEQVFVSFDVFYDHRQASESEQARHTYDRDGMIGEGFGDYRELTAGDELPENATVGEVAPCKPTDSLDESSKE